MELDSFKDLSLPTIDKLMDKCCDVILKEVLPYDKKELSKKINQKKRRNYQEYDTLLIVKRQRLIKYTTSLKHLVASYIIENNIKYNDKTLVKDCIDFLNYTYTRYYGLSRWKPKNDYINACYSFESDSKHFSNFIFKQ